MKKTFLILFIFILTIMSINSRSKTIPGDSHYFKQEKYERQFEPYNSPFDTEENQ